MLFGSEIILKCQLFLCSQPILFYLRDMPLIKKPVSSVNPGTKQDLNLY